MNRLLVIGDILYSKQKNTYLMISHITFYESKLAVGYHLNNFKLISSLYVDMIKNTNFVWELL